MEKVALIAKVAGSLADDYDHRGGYLSGDHVLWAFEKWGFAARTLARSRSRHSREPAAQVLVRQAGLAGSSVEPSVGRTIGMERTRQPQQQRTPGRVAAVPSGIPQGQTYMGLKHTIVDGLFLLAQARPPAPRRE